MVEGRPLTKSEIDDELERVAFWEDKNEAANDAGIPVSNKRGEEGTVDPEFEDLDEDGHRNFR